MGNRLGMERQTAISWISVSFGQKEAGIEREKSLHCDNCVASESLRKGALWITLSSKECFVPWGSSVADGRKFLR
jgi:hypothetical protein